MIMPEAGQITSFRRWLSDAAQVGACTAHRAAVSRWHCRVSRAQVRAGQQKKV